MRANGHLLSLARTDRPPTIAVWPRCPNFNPIFTPDLPRPVTNGWNLKVKFQACFPSQLAEESTPASLEHDNNTLPPTQHKVREHAPQSTTKKRFYRKNLSSSLTQRRGGGHTNGEHWGGAKNNNFSKIGISTDTARVGRSLFFHGGCCQMDRLNGGKVVGYHEKRSGKLQGWHKKEGKHNRWRWNHSPLKASHALQAPYNALEVYNLQLTSSACLIVGALALMTRQLLDRRSSEFPLTKFICYNL